MPIDENELNNCSPIERSLFEVQDLLMKEAWFLDQDGNLVDRTIKPDTDSIIEWV